MKQRTTYFEFPVFNCLSSLYSSEAQYNTIWHNKCVQYYHDVGSIATPGESSFKVTDRENEQPQLCLAKEQSSFSEAQIAQGFCPTKRKTL
nr:hypothetical protein [Tanacetum cinerariifolium]